MLVPWIAASRAAAAEGVVPSAVGTSSALRFSIIKTGDVQTREGLAVAGGSLAKQVMLNHVAILIERDNERVLFDTGLGERIDQQFVDDMPWWGKMFFKYNKLKSARQQMLDAGLPPPSRIVLSHGHWDHASGVVDYPQVPVWAAAEEIAFVGHRHAGSVFESQFSFERSRWHPIPFDGPGIAGYERSHDLFGDGSALLVPMPGHTPGAVGLLLTIRGGRRFFFVGDTVWKTSAIEAASPKFWLASKVVDDDAAQSLQQVRRLRDFVRLNPSVVIVPAHDAAVHEGLGYFPRWVE